MPIRYGQGNKSGCSKFISSAFTAAILVGLQIASQKASEHRYEVPLTSTLVPDYSFLYTPTPEIATYPQVEIVEANGDWLSHTDTVKTSGLTLQQQAVAPDVIHNIIEPALSEFSPTFYRNLNVLNPQILLSSTIMVYDEKAQEWVQAGGVSTNIDGKPAIILDINYLNKSVIVHELSHMAFNNLTYVPEGTAESLLHPTFDQITSEAGLIYHNEWSITDSFGCTTVDPVGFESCYGSSDWYEDEATIATSLFAGDKYFYERMADDDVLREKANTIIEFYTYVSGGEMNRDFFERIRRSKTSPLRPILLPY
ncbi:MAG: hypothetical protein UT34_C0001G0520 [candidate division WS6 bacterium GW2011_GWF2_39_15]|uniref:Uncharacterized protein n=1 Tax=candidate division WS6 bacterium GW2011_GWF2_39_15 TaxID=1619100 RepID=A0A0G0MR16_9BACT|nr:MAG: hypothetical protein UT34_C0001G0520 [candidate division WS6 bacterium GW2011_GWF2_39_15]